MVTSAATLSLRVDLQPEPKRARATSASSADSAGSVASESDQPLLERLRPLVLDQLGLREALARLVDAWATRYPSIKWTRRLAEVGARGHRHACAARARAGEASKLHGERPMRLCGLLLHRQRAFASRPLRWQQPQVRTCAFQI